MPSIASKPADTRFHLIRHGLVADDWRGRIYGDLDVPLSPEGERELVRAAAALDGTILAAVISSGLARAEFGAALLRRPRGFDRRDEPELREICRGEWRGLSFDELERAEPGALAAWRASPEARPPAGESLDELAARVLPRLDALAAEFAGAEIAIVTHSWVARVAAATALGLGPHGAHALDLPTGRAVTLDWPSSPVGTATLAAFAGASAPARAVRWHRGPQVR